MSVNEFFFRINTTATLTNANFVVWQLPEPSQAPFRDHTERRTQGGGGEGRHGHNTVDWLWSRLTAAHVQVLLDMIATAETANGQGNGTLYFTTPKTSKGGVHWVDCQGIVIMPQWTPTEGIHGLAYENVSLRFNDVTVDNDPSTVNY